MGGGVEESVWTSANGYPRALGALHYRHLSQMLGILPNGPFIALD
jgi:hypothetical protein